MNRRETFQLLLPVLLVELVVLFGACTPGDWSEGIDPSRTPIGAAQHPGVAPAPTRISPAGPAPLAVAWLQALDAKERTGATFLVECDNTQDGANHVHSVWRDLDGDWGRDLLAEHYRTSPHHAAERSPGAAVR